MKVKGKNYIAIVPSMSLLLELSGFCNPPSQANYPEKLFLTSFSNAPALAEAQNLISVVFSLLLFYIQFSRYPYFGGAEVPRESSIRDVAVLAAMACSA